jgi:hypothetical protein
MSDDQKILDYQNPTRPRRRKPSKWFWIYLIGVPICGWIYTLVYNNIFTIWAMIFGIPQYSRSVDRVSAMMELPAAWLWPYYRNWTETPTINGVIWGFLVIGFFHAMAATLKRLRRG